jgi:glycerol-3-phosphate acyltransferase PlsY
MTTAIASTGLPAWARATGVVTAAYLVGSVPFAQLLGRRDGIDLRAVGTGTVSGTGLYRATGMRQLIIAGVLDVAKGTLGPLLAGRRSRTAMVAAGATVVGHNWSVFLRGAGGRGISPAMGALLVTAPAGTAVLLTGLAVGRLAGETAAGCAVADAALVPVTARVSGRRGGLAAAAVVAPIVAKRLAGNAPPQRRDLATYAARLLLDRDTWRKTVGG